MNKLFIEAVSENAIIPRKQTRLSAGLDIHCDVKDRLVTIFDEANQPYQVHETNEPIYIQPMHRAIIPTGWKMRCAEDECIKFHPRSGLSIKAGITMINCMGLIDADYPDETGLLITNFSKVPFKVEHGDRLGQLMVEKVEPTVVEVVGVLPTVVSDRTGGFGSTKVRVASETEEVTLV